jgi:hypothetical protein
MTPMPSCNAAREKLATSPSPLMVAGRVGRDNAGIFVVGTRGIRILKNVIEKACVAPTLKEGRAGIYVMTSRDVEIEGNTVEPRIQGSGFRSALEVGPGCPSGTVKTPDDPRGRIR